MNAATMQPRKSSPLYKSLFVQVVAALVLGVVLGMATPGFAIGLKFFSDAFP
jgi:aerobic C4-dicarboxylate transport protein